MTADSQKWSEDDFQTLVSMLDEGASYADIASEIGRSYSAVASKALGMRRPTPKADASPRAVLSVAKWQSSGERLTAQVFGDPPPGRSALDQRAYQSIPSNKRQQNG